MKLNHALDRGIVEDIERFLRAKHAELRASEHRIRGQALLARGGQPADQMERAGEVLDDSIQGALMECWGRQAAQIEAALVRLASHEYGVCHDCSGFIGVARLRALPFAQRCMPCQARTESARFDPFRGEDPSGRHETQGGPRGRAA